MAEPHQSRVYSDLARFYDQLWGRAFVDHEHEVIEGLNLRPDQKVLEVGVGTGISLDSYPQYVKVVGLDPSADMLRQAVRRVHQKRWQHIELRQGDALNLEFADNSFDWVCTFHVITVVPDPVKMMGEMVRVCRPGGRIVIVAHFSSEKALLYLFNTLVNPLCKFVGWSTRLRARDVLEGQKIKVEELRRVSRFSIHDLIIARKDA